MNALLAVGWEWELRGTLIVIMAVGVLCGSLFLILGTNLGARLGFLVALTGLAGWMFIMGAVWWTYGKGVLGPDPTWQPVAGVTVIRDPGSLHEVGVIDAPFSPTKDPAADFVAFFHKPHYALVEVAPLVPQREEPGRAPARAVIDTSRPHEYVYMIRDMGSKRVPSAIICISSLVIFLTLCWMLHTRDRRVALNRSAKAIPAKV